jgi:hypothetical protein
VTDGRGITAPETSFAPSSFQELIGDLLLQMGECQALRSEPSCEVAQEPQALSHGRVGIPQFPEGSDERVQVRGERVFSVGLGGRTVGKGLLEHVTSPSWLMGCPQRKGCPDYAALTARGVNSKA